MKLNKLFLSSILILFFFQSQSQTGLGHYYISGSAYSLTKLSDYQSVGYNPANLGINETPHKLHLGIGQAGISIYSEPLRRNLVNDLFNNKKTFTDEEREEAVLNFTGSDLDISPDVLGLGIAYHHSKYGGIGFCVQEHAHWNSNLNASGAEILFKGFNASYFDTLQIDGSDTTGIAYDPEEISKVFGNTQMKMLWYRDYNLSYGITLINQENLSISVGVGIKYIEGYGIFKYAVTGSNEEVAYAALSPVFGINYSTPSPSLINSTKHQPTGRGFGFDAGVHLHIMQKIKVGLSILNIGSIKWDGNVYRVLDSNLGDLDFSGLNNYNIFLADDNILLADGKWGDWEGIASKKVDLPAALRGGAAYRLNRMFEFGADIYFPLNDVPGNVSEPVIGAGATVSPLGWLQVSTGIVSHGKYGINVPLGVIFKPFNNQRFMWEFGISTYDLLSWTQQQNPTVAFAFGFLRFGFMGKAVPNINDSQE